MHVLCECVSRQYCTTLSCHLLRKSLTTEVQQLCSTQNRSGQEWPTEIRKKQTTDGWTHRNYLKGGYTEGVVTLFSGKGWGIIDTRRNISIIYKENITWLVWPAMRARPQRSCGLHPRRKCKYSWMGPWAKQRAPELTLLWAGECCTWSPEVLFDLHNSMMLKNT